MEGPVALAGLRVRVVGDIEAQRADWQDEAEAHADRVLHVVEAVVVDRLTEVSGVAEQGEFEFDGVSELKRRSFYNWRSKYAGMDVSEAKRLKELESENNKLKKLLAEKMLEAEAMKDVLSKKW